LELPAFQTIKKKKKRDGKKNVARRRVEAKKKLDTKREIQKHDNHSPFIWQVGTNEKVNRRKKKYKRGGHRTQVEL